MAPGSARTTLVPYYLVRRPEVEFVFSEDAAFFCRINSPISLTNNAILSWGT